MRTRVKICGITRSEDALLAIQQGADAIGLVFYEPSPRAVTIKQAAEILNKLPPFVSVVGLFVDAKPEDIKAALAKLPLSLLQFHGDETPEDCEQYGIPYIKAVRMREETDLSSLAKEYSSASALLLDSFKVGVPGGTGLTFDWSIIPNHIKKPVILAGGLSAANVIEAIEQTQPFAVDVSGGVEEKKGIKCADKITAFMNEVANTNERVKRG